MFKHLGEDNLQKKKKKTNQKHCVLSTFQEQKCFQGYALISVTNIWNHLKADCYKVLRYNNSIIKVLCFENGAI